MKLLLFDIDGTLLLTHGLGRSSLERAVHEVTGHRVSTERVNFSGKTDPRILRELLEVHDLAIGPDDPTFHQILANYTAIVGERIDPERVEVLPGVPALIRHLADRDDLQLALVTGNLEATARLKLEAAELAPYFPFGAFGSDSADRNDLPGIAVERARRHTGRSYDGRDVVIIGDTEHDIVCGRRIGAFSVGVCTGFYEREELLAHTPDVLLENLADLDIFTRDVLDGE